MSWIGSRTPCDTCGHDEAHHIGGTGRCPVIVWGYTRQWPCPCRKFQTSSRANEAHKAAQGDGGTS